MSAPPASVGTDAARAEFEARGASTLNGPIDRPWGLRTATFADPDGHVWEVAAELAQKDVA